MTNDQTTTVRAVLSFADASGKIGRISIPRAKTTTTMLEATNSMQNIINTTALHIRSIGAITQAKHTDLVETVRTRIVGQ